MAESGQHQFKFLIMDNKFVLINHIFFLHVLFFFCLFVFSKFTRKNLKICYGTDYNQGLFWIENKITENQ